MMTYWGSASTVPLNSRVSTTRSNSQPSRSLYLASGYAAMEAMTTLATVVSAVMKALLNRYRENGTRILATSLNSME